MFKREYIITGMLILLGSINAQDLKHSTEFYWAEKFPDQTLELSGTLNVNSPIFNDFLANAPAGRIVINRRGCKFHTDGSEDMSGYPSWVAKRAELREAPLSTVPTGQTHVYEYIWDVDMLPHLEGPLTIFQRFHKSKDGPDIDIELAGEGQFNDAPNGTAIFHGFNSGWVRTQKELKNRNHLLVAIYSDSAGHYKVSLNGETLIENDAYTIPDTIYSGQQFGIYNHGGTVARIQFTHVWYSCREYNGKADFSQLNSADPNISSAKRLHSSQSLPQEFSLMQNYPNPFNPSTNIEFSIPMRRHVELKIYDLLGKEVETLLSEELDAGEYNFRFDADSLPSGIYIYRILAGSFSESKKLILVK